MAKNVEDKFILLRDVQGLKSGKSISVARKQKPCSIEKGELLQALPTHNKGSTDEALPHNYYCSINNAIATLYADEGDVAQLSERKFELLEAIQKPRDRHRVFTTEGWLDWGAELTEGSTASVALEGTTAGTQFYTGVVVRFVGKIGNNPGLRFGVEIMVRYLFIYA